MVYIIGILAFLAVYLFVGLFTSKKVKDLNDYYVAGRNAPTILIVGSLVASFLSTGAFLGETGEVYSGYLIPQSIVGVLCSVGYLWGGIGFGKYLRRSGVLTVSEYYGKRFCSSRMQKLAAITSLLAVLAYMLSAIQGITTLMSALTGLDYKLCVIIAWASFTFFTISSGSIGVLLTDTIMFLVFTVATVVAMPYITQQAGGWMEAIKSLATSQTLPDIISWHGNLDHGYANEISNLIWGLVYGLVWAITISVSPWQTSRYLMAKNEHVVLRSSVWASIGVMTLQVMLYFIASFIYKINPDLVPTQCMIWAAQNTMPTLIGVVLLAGIMSAGISSASTFLSLIGFAITNDLLPKQNVDEKNKLKFSRLGMLIASIVILIIAYLNPPQIYVIMYFGSSVIASAWGAVSFASIWSKKISENGAFWGMLSGFVVCSLVKILSAFYPGKWPILLEPFILGMIASVFGIIIGSKLRPAKGEEQTERAFLFQIPDGELEPAQIKKTKHTGYYYLIFAVAVFAFFWFLWAVPYLNA